MRLFVAIALPDTLRSHLRDLCNGLPAARWVAPENLHLTLRFIGEVEGHHAADIAPALSGIPLPRFYLTLPGVGDFGHGRRLRPVGLGVDPTALRWGLRGQAQRPV